MVSGNLTVDPKEINNHFRDFYKSENTENREAQSNVLDRLQFHTLSDDEKAKLDSPLTIADLCEAIGDINKAPDRFPIEFYKTFKKQLVKPLLDMFEESFVKGTHSLRLAMKQATNRMLILQTHSLHGM